MAEQTNLPDIEDGAHTPVQLAARAVQAAFWQEWNVRLAWPLLDPVLRRVWVQHWHSHLEPTVADALGDRDALVNALTVDDPGYRWWAFFEASAVEFLAGLVDDDVMGWGISAVPHVVAPDMELLALWPAEADGSFDESGPCVPMLMQYTPDTGWRLLNFLDAVIPEPGWPPAW